VPEGGTGGGGPTTAPPGSTSTDWVSYANGPRAWFNATGETKITVENVATLKSLWMQNSGEVNGTPVVASDKVYVVTNSGTRSYGAADGMPGWTSPMARGQVSPAYDPETKMLFVSGGGLSAGPCTLTAFDAAAGTVKWGPKPCSAQGGSTGWASACVIGKYVATGLGAFDTPGTMYKGGLAAFDKVSGESVLTYQQATTGAGASIWSGVSGDETAGIMYAGSGNNYVIADDRSDSLFAVDIAAAVTSKMPLWNFQATKDDTFALGGPTMSKPDHDFGTHPMVVDYMGKRMLIAGQKSGVLWALDRDKGTELWKTPISMASSAGTGGILNNGAFDGERIIVAANEATRPGSVAAVKADTGEVVWKKPMMGLSLAPISVANGVCFVPDGSTLRIFNCKTGDQLHEIPAGGTIGSGVAISNGRIYFGVGWSYGFAGTRSSSNTLHAYGIP
jgi:polyvinyl alcohol dehydrogenase (cytochrome)